MNGGQQSLNGAAGKEASLLVPPEPMVAVEHPFVVQDLPKAIRSLGGDQCVQDLIQEENVRNSARLLLRPEDRFSRTVESCIIRGTNVVMRIEVPRRTGRRRKRGSTGPFVEIDTLKPTDEKRLLRALRDNPTRSTAVILGQVDRTHRFRDPPDFTWATGTNQFLSHFKDTLLSPSYRQISRFRLDPDSQRSELIPPPTIAPSAVPWAYFYRQNASVKTIEVDGQKRTFNASLQERPSVIAVRYDEQMIPSPSKKDLEEAFRALNSYEQELVSQIQKHFESRPVWTRRSLVNTLRAEGMYQQQLDHHIYAQVAYTFSSGPWRDTVVRYGVDPRKEPNLRIYQTMSFRTDDVAPDWKADNTAVGTSQTLAVQDRRKSNRVSMENSAQTLEQNHIFDGKLIDNSGKLWQMCDITDTTVKKLLESARVRETCDMRSSGWYHNGTWAKARAILKAKIRHILETGKPLDDSRSRHIRHILRIPDVISDENLSETLIERSVQNKDIVKVTENIRTRAQGSLQANTDIGMTSKHGRAELPQSDPDEILAPAKSRASEEADETDGVNELPSNAQDRAGKNDVRSNDDRQSPDRCRAEPFSTSEPEQGRV